MSGLNTICSMIGGSVVLDRRVVREFLEEELFLTCRKGLEVITLLV